jgi:hypothetical protein
MLLDRQLELYATRDRGGHSELDGMSEVCVLLSFLFLNSHHQAAYGRLISMQHCYLTERRGYLGSRPDDARKDSHTYSIGQTTCAAMTAMCGKHTDRTNFKAGIFQCLLSCRAMLSSAWQWEMDKGGVGLRHASALASAGRNHLAGTLRAGFLHLPHATHRNASSRRESSLDHDTPIVGTTSAHINHDVGLVISGARFPRAVACADS